MKKWHIICSLMDIFVASFKSSLVELKENSFKLELIGTLLMHHTFSVDRNKIQLGVRIEIVNNTQQN